MSSVNAFVIVCSLYKWHLGMWEICMSTMKRAEMSVKTTVGWKRNEKAGRRWGEDVGSHCVNAHSLARVSQHFIRG